MANICSTSIVIVDTLENLEKINKAIENHEVQENTDKGWGGNILRALGAEVNEHVCYGFIEYSGEIKPAKDIEGLHELHLECEDRWMRGEFVECLQELFPEAEIYWISEEPGCQYCRTNDIDGKYFPDRWVVITDEDWEYFETEDDMLDYLKENFGIESLDDIETYNENNEDGNTVTVYECEEE